MLTNILTFVAFAVSVVTQYTTIAVIGINDIHGTALPTLLQRQDNMENYTYGGLQYMADQINIIKD